MKVTIEIPDAVVEESLYIPRDIAVVYVPGDDYKIFVRREWLVDNVRAAISVVESETEVIRIHGDSYEDNPRSTIRGY